MITDFLHNYDDAEKAFVSNQEWWIISGSVKVQIFLTSLDQNGELIVCLLYTSPSPRDYAAPRMPSSA